MGTGSFVTVDSPQYIQSSIGNLSRTGFYFRSVAPIEVGQAFDFSFSIPELASSLQGTAEIRWCQRSSENHYGCRFTHLPPVTERLLLEVLTLKVFALTAADLMVRGTQILKPETRVFDGIAMLNASNHQALLCVDEDAKPLGVMTPELVVSKLQTDQIFTQPVGSILDGCPDPIPHTVRFRALTEQVDFDRFGHYPVVDENGKGIGILTMARLAAMMAEATILEVHQAKAQCERAISHIAHDLRGSLGVAFAGCELLCSQQNLDERYTQPMERALSRSLLLTEDLADCAGGETPLGQRSIHDLADCVFQAAEETKSSAEEKDITLEIQGISDRFHPVLVDRKRICRALRKTLEWAIFHTFPGHRIQIKVSTDEANSEVTIWTDAKIPDDWHNGRSPKPYYETPAGPDENKPKTDYGFGLVLADRDMKAHSGSLFMEPTGEGRTELTARLPRVIPSET